MAIAGLSGVRVYKALPPRAEDTIERLFPRSEPFPALRTHDIFKVHAVPTGRWDRISALPTRVLKAALIRSRWFLVFFGGMPTFGISFAACSPYAFIHQWFMLATAQRSSLFLESNLHQFARIRGQFSQLSRRACCLINKSSCVDGKGLAKA